MCVSDVQELGIKHPLHRKKLQLALQALGSEEEDNKGKLDYNWVMSEWLASEAPLGLQLSPCVRQTVFLPRMAGRYRPASV